MPIIQDLIMLHRESVARIVLATSHRPEILMELHHCKVRSAEDYQRPWSTSVRLLCFWVSSPGILPSTCQLYGRLNTLKERERKRTIDEQYTVMIARSENRSDTPTAKRPKNNGIKKGKNQKGQVVSNSIKDLQANLAYYMQGSCQPGGSLSEKRPSRREVWFGIHSQASS